MHRPLRLINWLNHMHRLYIHTYIHTYIRTHIFKYLLAFVVLVMPISITCNNKGHGARRRCAVRVAFENCGLAAVQDSVPLRDAGTVPDAGQRERQGGVPDPSGDLPGSSRASVANRSGPSVRPSVRPSVHP